MPDIASKIFCIWQCGNAERLGNLWDAIVIGIAHNFDVYAALSSC